MNMRTAQYHSDPLNLVNQAMIPTDLHDAVLAVLGILIIVKGISTLKPMCRLIRMMRHPYQLG